MATFSKELIGESRAALKGNWFRVVRAYLVLLAVTVLTPVVLSGLCRVTLPPPVTVLPLSQAESLILHEAVSKVQTQHSELDAEKSVPVLRSRVMDILREENPAAYALAMKMDAGRRGVVVDLPHKIASYSSQVLSMVLRAPLFLGFLSVVISLVLPVIRGHILYAFTRFRLLAGSIYLSAGLFASVYGVFALSSAVVSLSHSPPIVILLTVFGVALVVCPYIVSVFQMAAFALIESPTTSLLGSLKKGWSLARLHPYKIAFLPAVPLFSLPVIFTLSLLFGAGLALSNQSIAPSVGSYLRVIVALLLASTVLYCMVVGFVAQAIFYMKTRLSSRS